MKTALLNTTFSYIHPLVKYSDHFNEQFFTGRLSKTSTKTSLALCKKMNHLRGKHQNVQGLEGQAQLLQENFGLKNLQKFNAGSANDMKLHWQNKRNVYKRKRHEAKG